MVETVAEHGYAGASVARVSDRAAVTRRTFYSYFSGREDCFAAAYRGLVIEATAVAGTIIRTTCAAERPRVLLEALLSGVAADPAAARLAFFGVQAAPAGVRATHEESIRRLERGLARCLRDGWRPEKAPQLPVTALRGGVESVVSIRVLRGEAASVPALCDDLFRWIESYRPLIGAAPLETRYWDRLADRFLPRWRGPRQEPSLLPRGRSALSAERAAAERRLRLLEATLRITAERGYAGATVAEIAAAARLNKAAFYSHFHSKQDAFLAAQRLRLEESLAAAASAFYAEREWLNRVWAGLQALLRYLAENPHAAVSGLGEAHAAGEEAIRLEHDIRLAFTLFLEEGYRQRWALERPPPPISSEAIAGANHALIRQQVLFGDPAYLPRLLPQLTYVTVAPFVGHDAAIAFIETAAAERRVSREAAAVSRGSLGRGQSGLQAAPG